MNKIVMTTFSILASAWILPANAMPVHPLSIDQEVTPVHLRCDVYGRCSSRHAHRPVQRYYGQPRVRYYEQRPVVRRYYSEPYYAAPVTRYYGEPSYRRQYDYDRPGVGIYGPGFGVGIGVGRGW